ncbi:hypothetical protein B0I72DRAFT_142704 [Yarrowia lipolytica]|jgi:hypothetical protein|uniref:YALI0D00781p n=2 Tax=Yarrowia lipolytica TaxID=4952 RepID=Q6CAQ6_YARLI|nr:YALI0D00781p [Yarrowia lipolytica CLIB122]AOW03395.1 hypothetical protein YALI1_D00824g [Yarrowia lipolytica]KAB8282574.1 hypothetical protein BKA91DRAFT_138326 [Yarrowia lipolytica]KAE8173224.1 hypothetical protein BKA90DRAFT_136111 [Yarrowia lipolytica]KAJ8054946.1 hypothetical protein LXG23DRAFT_37037 [Yarrowia lipolytica]RDW22960.1 hypothetical protein B0I71DRAFT_136737 [Yarrowia lipolytica]|eukprot:XP_502256.1 YALI0D00781p [Yarrowia lipolytica CLIB122]
MSLPARLSRMAHRFFSQIVAEDESEDESNDVGFVPRTEDLTVEYDTCIDISSVIDVVGTERDASDRDDVVEGEGDGATGDIVTDMALTDMDDVSSAGDASSDGDASSIGGDDGVAVVDKDITSTIVNEVVESRDRACDGTPEAREAGHQDTGAVPVSNHVHSQTIKVTRAPRLRPDLSDSEMSGISDESEVDVEVENVVDTDAPLTDVINGIVRERRKQAKREARKRAKTHQKNKGYKISKPHKKHEHNAKELEAIERQLEEEV